MTNFRVAKFGGTSMGDLSAMSKAAQLVKQDPMVRLVVVSATSGTTNLLLRAYQSKVGGSSTELQQAMEGIFRRHRLMAQEVGSTAEVELILEEVTKTIDGIQEEDDAKLDELLAMGERMSSVLFAATLSTSGVRAEVIDARTLLKTDSRFGKAEPILSETRLRCESLLLPKMKEGITFVTQGFIGSDAQNRTTTLGRGGSDYSAALFSEAIDGESCWIWTDVNGIYSIDPRMVPSATVIPEITFDEAAELANFGAKVLHPATLVPAIRAGIRVFVGNTFAPTSGGTWIFPELTDRPLMRAIAVRDRQTLVTVTSMDMLNTHGFLARLFTTLANHKISIDLVTTSEVSVALTIDGTSSGSSGKSILQNQALMDDLREIAEVQVEENLSLVALVGNRISSTPGVAARAFQAVGLDNVRLICHGASPNNLCFLVSTGQAKRVASRLHEAFL